MDQRMVAHRRPVVVAAGNERSFRLRSLQDETGAGLVLSDRDRLVQQRLVMDNAAGLDAATC